MKLEIKIIILFIFIFGLFLNEYVIKIIRERERDLKINIIFYEFFIF